MKDNILVVLVLILASISQFPQILVQAYLYPFIKSHTKSITFMQNTKLRIKVFRDVMPPAVADRDPRFRKSCCSYLRGRQSSFCRLDSHGDRKDQGKREISVKRKKMGHLIL
jgi:hypothetical protein